MDNKIFAHTGNKCGHTRPAGRTTRVGQHFISSWHSHATSTYELQESTFFKEIHVKFLAVLSNTTYDAARIINYF